MARACGAGPGDRILDVGCGTGYFASRLAPQILPGGTVTGIDPSPPMLAYADKRSPAQCRFVFAGAEDLPFADGDFDVVVSSLAFHHIPDTLWPQAMSEIMRVLRPAALCSSPTSARPRSTVGPASAGTHRSRACSR
ncbi:class I SAM-dependent methyltransferase [Mycolicibacterium tokaiense]|uniref:class I SAM-dependent methyltransferase n=1 Tax=Mycolicibacterium tokaiense TaxID=39695 RepID=UPI000E1B97D7|nr:class I SAM-dependent methyltransferase [Mycolicibacterium tokaiense]